jgi:deoxyribonuclease V
MSAMPRIEVTWPQDVESARLDQIGLRGLLSLQPFDLRGVSNGLAIGVGYNERKKKSIAVGIPMLISGEPLAKDAVFITEEHTEFPYHAGLFVYREGPAVVSLLNSLPTNIPFLLLCGQGIAHPRGFGLASHIGVLSKTPSIGLTRKRLWGFARPPKLGTTEQVELRDRQGAHLGITTRALPNCEPIFASPGHLTDMQTVRRFLGGVTAVKGCFPEALCIAQEEANRRSHY